MSPMKTVIIGLGNPIISDDGVGPLVVAELANHLNENDVTITEASVGGLGLVDLLAGHQRAIIVDAIQTANGQPGQIYQLDPSTFNKARHVASPHDVDFATALEFGKRMGMALPDQIDIFAIEAADVTTFSEGCTPEIVEAIPKCVELILKEVDGGLNA